MYTVNAGPDLEEGGPLLTYKAAVATITLNRPSHRNRLHASDLQRLLEHFDAIDAHDEVRVMLLRGRLTAEHAVFCSGYHLGEQDGERGGPTAFSQVTDRLENLRPLTICCMNGSVYGGATDFALACDFAIGARGMKMRMPAAALGLHYYPGGILRYVSRLGVANAKRALLAAEVFDDDALLEMGYVHRLFEPHEFEDDVQKFVQELISLAPLAQQAMKRSINEAARGEYDQVRFRQRQHASQASEDFAEGCRAFSERRRPVFRGQ